jgi:hypothetical protein
MIYFFTCRSNFPRFRAGTGQACGSCFFYDKRGGNFLEEILPGESPGKRFQCTVCILSWLEIGLFRAFAVLSGTRSIRLFEVVSLRVVCIPSPPASSSFSHSLRRRRVTFAAQKSKAGPASPVSSRATNRLCRRRPGFGNGIEAGMACRCRPLEWPRGILFLSAPFPPSANLRPG